jgi:hypothetical protein
MYLNPLQSCQTHLRGVQLYRHVCMVVCIQIYVSEGSLYSLFDCKVMHDLQQQFGVLAGSILWSVNTNGAYYVVGSMHTHMNSPHYV